MTCFGLATFRVIPVTYVRHYYSELVLAGWPDVLLMSAEIAKRYMVGSAHGRLTFKGSHRLARGKAFEGLRTQAARVASAADSRGSRREQGSAEPVGEAGSPEGGVQALKRRPLLPERHRA